MAFVKPVFEKTLAGKIDSGTAVFSAAISGNPWPEIKWFINDEFIDSSNDRFKIDANEETGEISLTVEKISEFGSSVYMCELTNRLGTVSRKININLGGAKKTASGEDIIPPTFEIPLKPKIEKTTGTFSCKVAGYPRPAVKWFVNNEEVEDDEIHKITYLEDGTATMVVPDLTDIGTAAYRCEISNEGGTVKSGKFDLKVPKKDDNMKPKFVQQIKPQVMGQTATFEAKATGKPMPNIQWFVNDEEITGNDENFTLEVDIESGSTKLKIADISKVGPAKYVCKASNASGSASSIVTIGGESNQKKDESNEADKPKFVEQMKHSVQKSDILLTAKISGSPVPNINWYVNGQLVVDDGGETFKVSCDAELNISLLVKNFRQYGNTEYKVVIYSRRGSAKNRLELTLNPNDPPAPKTDDPDFSAMRPKFVEPLTPNITDRDVQVEGRVVGQPLPNLTWTVNDSEVSYDDTRFDLDYQATGIIVFRLRNPSEFQGGKVSIVCVAANDKGETTSRVQIDLTKFKAPVDQKQEEKVTNLLSKPISSGLKNGRQYFDFQVKSKPNTVMFFIDGEAYADKHKTFFRLEFEWSTLTAFGECLQQPKYVTQVEIKVVVTIKGVEQTCTHTFQFDKALGDEEVIDDEVKPDFERPRQSLQKRKLPSGAARASGPMQFSLPQDDVIELVINFEGDRPSGKWTIDGKDVSKMPDAKVTTRDNKAILILKNREKYLTSDIVFTIDNNISTANNSFTIQQNRPVLSENLIDKSIKKKSPSDEAPKFVSKFTIKRVKMVCIIEGKIVGKPGTMITWFKNGQPLDPKDPKFKQVSKPDGTVSIDVPDNETESGLDLTLIAENYLGTIEQSFVLIGQNPRDVNYLDSTQLLLLFLSDPSLREFLESFLPDELRQALCKPKEQKKEPEKKNEPEKKEPKKKKVPTATLR